MIFFLRVGSLFDQISYQAQKILLMMMKIATLLMLIVSVMGFSPSSNAQKVSLKVKDAKIEDVFANIQTQTNYSFAYEKDLLKNAKSVTADITNKSLDEALQVIFKNQHITYKIHKNYIVLSALKNKNTSKSVVEEFKNQQSAISGTVRDQSGKVFQGASVSVQGTSNASSTNASGEFRLNNVKVGDKLVVRYVGYVSQTITIQNLNTPFAISLQAEDNTIEDVVVTALGIKRTERSLTYNNQEIKGEELTRNKDANFVNGLVGKVAGVTINSSSAGVGGAARVVMRGIKSISGNNNAMYVIDGVPVINTTGGVISDIFSANTNTDIMSTINPEDIESISVLTGPAATALYGQEGQNGVVIINTKSGNKDGSTTLGIVNNTTFYTPLVMPEFQNTFGPTDQGSSQSWGPKLAEPSTYRPKDFFQTGNNTTFGVNFSTGTQKNQTYFSSDMVKANGIMPNNTIDRYNVSLRNQATFLNDKLLLDVNGRFSNQKEMNMIAQGLYHNPLVPIYLFPPGDNIEAIKIFERYDVNRLFPTQYWPFMGDQFRTENPWWILNREPNENRSNRLLFTGSLKYTINDWLNITVRGTYDNIDGNSEQLRYASTDQLFSGYGGYSARATSFNKRMYGDIIANINKNWGDFGITSNIGIQRTEDRNNSMFTELRIPEGTPPNVFSTDMATAISRFPDRNSYQSGFLTAGVSYKNMLFVDGSIRRDYDSRLYFNENSKLYLDYPAIGMSAIVSDIFNIKSDALSYFKVRANYAEAGNAPSLYIGGPQVFGISAGKIQQNQTLHLPLTPERTKSTEIGANLKFLNNKINLDVTLYNASTENQIFEVSQSITNGGYSSFYINAGKVQNRGIEAALGYNSKIGDVNWNSNFTYTINKNIVKELYNTTDENGNEVPISYLDRASAGSYLQRASVGNTLSSIYTTAHLKLDEKGYVMLPLSVDVNSTNPTYAGHADPKYTMGWNNGFSYKNFNLNFLIFARIGGVGVSATQAMMDAYGVSKTSADVRDLGFVELNGYPFADVQNYYTQMGSGLNGVLGYYVYSATNVRLRELSVGYTIPNSILKTNAIKNIKVALTGNNLFMFYNKSPFDPESTASSGTYYQGIDYFRQPSLRGLGFNLSAQF